MGECCLTACGRAGDAQNEVITYRPWGWRTVFLTEWGGWTQLCYFLATLIGPRFFGRVPDRFFTLAWPVGVFIGIMFYAGVLPGILSARAKGECGHDYPATVNHTDVCGASGTDPCAKTPCGDILIGAGLFGFFQHVRVPPPPPLMPVRELPPCLPGGPVPPPSFAAQPRAFLPFVLQAGRQGSC